MGSFVIQQVQKISICQQENESSVQRKSELTVVEQS